MISMILISALIDIIALNFLGQFFIFILMALAHEMGHMSVAFFFGERPKKIFLTLLGPIGFIENFENLPNNKKTPILIAGPLVSLVLIFIFRNYATFMRINFIILLFNMLPIYPLDGGQLLFLAMSKKMGILNANDFLFKIAKICLYAMFCLGLIQIILFPFNPSLIILSLYLNKKQKEHYRKIYFDFFKRAMQIL